LLINKYIHPKKYRFRNKLFLFYLLEIFDTNDEKKNKTRNNISSSKEEAINKKEIIMYALYSNRNYTALTIVLDHN
jgi:hypothetical protein